MKKIKFVNLTPHPVVVRPEPGKEYVFPKCDRPARVETFVDVIDVVDGIPIVSQRYGEIVDLPDPQEGVIYIVSLVVRMAAQKIGRTDVVSPDSSPQGVVERDKNGQIVAVKRLVGVEGLKQEKQDKTENTTTV